MTTDPHATCQTAWCGHAQDEHSRLSGCLAMVGNTARVCPCPEFAPPALPVTPYDGGTSSGHSGSTTSHARALHEDTSGLTKGRQEWVLGYAQERVDHGVTVKEVREVSGWHHGQASAALSNLHHGGLLVRLTETRDRCKVYVLPDYAGDRPTEAHGQRASKPRTPKARGPITLTPTEADALRRVASKAASAGLAQQIGVSPDDLRLVTAALEARVREPRQ